MPAAGGLRADFVKGPQTPHSTFFLLLDVRLHSHWNMVVTTLLWTIELGPQEATNRLVDSLGCIYTGMGDGPDRLALTSIQSVIS